MVLNGLVLMKYDNHINGNIDNCNKCDNAKAALDILSSI